MTSPARQSLAIVSLSLMTALAMSLQAWACELDTTLPSCKKREAKLEQEFKALVKNEALSPDELQQATQAFQAKLDTLKDCPASVERLTGFMAKLTTKELKKLVK